MSDIAIRVESLSKAYRIGLKEQQHETMLGAMSSWVKAPFRNFRNVRKLSRFDDARVNRGPQDRKSVVSGRLSVVSSEAPPSDVMWALEEVSFEVKKGEAVGIIGRNGAGKSTLLKILSRITEPTSGRATIYGRVGSLLEVGTGFHPDLTGRENVYLNGTILGMSKKDVDRKFDEMVEFSGVEKFIDTPVKRYSSGMKVRLAFAVAAHLEPEILIVDEVLAVGDVAFQKKCMGKMDEVAHQGRTVLFVSHNMGVVGSLCQRGLLLQDGVLSLDARIAEVISLYLDNHEANSSLDLSRRKDRKGEGNVRLTQIEIRGGENLGSENLVVGRPARFVFHLSRDLPNVGCRFTICDMSGIRVIHFNSNTPSSLDRVDLSLGPKLICEVNELAIAPGRYRLNVALVRGTVFEDHIESAVVFDVAAADIGGRIVSAETGFGLAFLRHQWIVGSRS